MGKVNITLAQRANRAVANGLEATSNIFDVVALGARATRDLAFVAAARAAALADAEEVSAETFKSVDDKVDSALGRQTPQSQTKLSPIKETKQSSDTLLLKSKEVYQLLAYKSIKDIQCILKTFK